MGRDKALLSWGPATLLDHALSLVREAFGHAHVLCGPVPRYAAHGAPLVLDRLQDGGPLAALDAALRHTGAARVVLLALDLPFVTPALLRFLAGVDRDADVVTPLGPGGRPEPLCAVYARACAEAVARRLDAGERKMTSFWPEVRVRAVAGPEMAGLGDPGRLFTNVNDPAAYEALRPS